jgi:MoxR-like ATPase
MFKILIDYPEKEGEVEIIDRFTEGASISVSKQVSAKELTEIQEFNRRVYADPKIKEYVAELVDASRHPEKYGLEINGSIEYGASPRASLWLILAAKAHAMVNGRGYVKPEDVKAVAYEVLRHRIILTYEAEAEEKTSDGIISLILDTIKVP